MKKRNILLALALCAVLVGCGTDTTPKSQSERAIYHWKTTFDPTEKEWDFLKTNDIQRMYVRFFDVDDSPAKPIATTVFKQNLPQDIEIIPTTFITLEPFHYYWLSDSARERINHNLANKIVTRLLKMAQAQHVEVKEVQFDCDWTASTEDDFFQTCVFARDTLHQLGIDLSVTIRLHQLSMLKNVPADRGVLMLYNTSSLKNYTVTNSILSYDVVRQYLSRVPQKHTLDLDFAYPTYSWGIWFDSSQEFNGILRKVDLSNHKLYKLKENNCYEVLKDHELEGHLLKEGDIIRWEESQYDEIMKVKKAVEVYPTLKGGQYSVILYHLDDSNLSKFSSHEIESIFHHQ